MRLNVPLASAAGYGIICGVLKGTGRMRVKLAAMALASAAMLCLRSARCWQVFNYAVIMPYAPPRKRNVRPPLGALPHPLGPNPRHFAVRRVYSLGLVVYTLHMRKCILSTGGSVYPFWYEVYTLLRVESIHFHKGRVYTFSQKCRGLRPKVSGVVSKGVRGCVRECRANCQERYCQAR